MRRKDREITERAELLAIVEACSVCRVALADEEGVYIVPLNFGYLAEGEELRLYFHSAKEGRKVRAFDQGAAVAFEMDGEFTLVPGKTACEYGGRFCSIVGSGWIAPVEAVEAKQQALARLMQHMTGEAWTITPEQAQMVQVYELTVTKMSGKARRD